MTTPLHRPFFLSSSFFFQRYIDTSVGAEGVEPSSMAYKAIALTVVLRSVSCALYPFSLSRTEATASRLVGIAFASPSKARFTGNSLSLSYRPLLSVTAFFPLIPVNSSLAVNISFLIPRVRIRTGLQKPVFVMLEILESYAYCVRLPIWIEGNASSPSKFFYRNDINCVMLLADKYTYIKRILRIFLVLSSPVTSYM